MGKPISLAAALALVAGEFTLDDGGPAYPVLQLNAGEYQQLRGEKLSFLECLEIVRRIVPTLPEEDYRRLNQAVVGGILAIADGNVHAVEDDLPNSSAPTEATLSAPESAPLAG